MTGREREAVGVAVDAGQDQPPVRFVAGADAMAAVEKKAGDLLAQVDALRELSGNLARNDA